MDVERSGPWRFRLTLTALVALLVAAPVLATTVLDLDARTPLTIAQETLHEKYGLLPVDEGGEAVPMDSSAVTVSEFSVQSGATTEDVPFSLDGRDVTCTVQVPSDPASVTADCTG